MTNPACRPGTHIFPARQEGDDSATCRCGRWRYVYSSEPGASVLVDRADIWWMRARRRVMANE